MAGKIAEKIREMGDLLKISHTVFALPFALSSMLIAAGGLPSLRVLILILLAMVTARSAGMSFNRFLDAEIDRRNPRTASRQIPRGVFSRRFILLFSVVNAGLFVLTASLLNPLCFRFSWAALALLYGYSFTKRFTNWSHLVLGLTLGSTPVAAWLAIRGGLAPEPIVLGAAVVFWVAGFDIIYATQDYEFDRKEGLHSAVVRFGIAKALWIARAFHLLTIVLFIVFGRMLQMGFGFDLSLMLIASLLAYEHSLVRANDLSRVNAAFFNVNGFISLLFLAGVVLSV